MDKAILKKIPNWLTYLRLWLIPILVVLLISPSQVMTKIATFVFLLAAFTDYLDGVLARKYGAVTDLGKLLDPVADKLLVMAALVMLAAIKSPDGQSWVPAWMVVIVLGREMWINGLRSIAASRGVVVPAGWYGKVKTVFQMIAIPALILHYPAEIGGSSISLRTVGIVLLLISIGFSLFSAYQYTRDILFGENTKNVT